GSEFLRDSRGVEPDGGRLIGGIREKAVVDELLPILFTAVRAGLESLTDNVVGSGLVEAADPGDDFQVGHAAEERFDERLDGNDGAIGGAGVAPGFEEVRLRQVPALGGE